MLLLKKEGEGINKFLFFLLLNYKVDFICIFEMLIFKFDLFYVRDVFFVEFFL